LDQSPHPIRSTSFVPRSACHDRCSTKLGQKGGVPNSTGLESRAELLTARALSGSASAKPKPPQLWPGASPEHQALIEECWNKRGKERRYTVPPKIKRRLCELAIAFVIVHTERGAGLFPMKTGHIWRVQYQLNNDAK
jgi:hypothetical protein